MNDEQRPDDVPTTNEAPPPKPRKPRGFAAMDPALRQTEAPQAPVPAVATSKRPHARRASNGEHEALIGVERAVRYYLNTYSTPEIMREALERLDDARYATASAARHETHYAGGQWRCGCGTMNAARAAVCAGCNTRQYP